MIEYSVNPLQALLIAIAITGIATLFLYPRKGILAYIARSRQNTDRILIEDALKHIYDCEYRNIECTLNSIAGSLSIPGDRATRLVARLTMLGLVESLKKGIRLTSEGRSYALRVIRIHRLWERFLADQTGVRETEWHTEAEIQEHLLTPDEADSLAARIGNPLTDPHGDPIPTPAGTVVKQKGITLNALEKGTFARIIHIEDEPEAIYRQLVAQDLHTGMQVRVIDATHDRITFEADGNECVLAPLFSANILVSPINNTAEVQENFTPLSSIAIGEEAEVVAISRKIRGQQRRRLMDLGIVPGTKISAVMKSAGNDPVAYRVRGALIALRKKQTDGIFIQRV
jgi:DtxR family transcriptional regulator, Mn-dependent transcriptional regulator